MIASRAKPPVSLLLAPAAGLLSGLLSLGPARAQPPPGLAPAPPSAADAEGGVRPLPPEDGEARLRALLVGGRGLTSDQVAARAVATSRDVAARRAGADAAKAREDQATAGFWPRVQFQARYTRLSFIEPVFLPGGLGTTDPADLARDQPRVVGPDETLIVNPRFPIPQLLNQGLLTAQVSVPVSDYVLRLARARRAAARTTLAAQKEEEASRRQIAADARIAFYDWIRARGAALVMQQRLASTQAQVKDAQSLFDAGFASRADVLRAESGLKAVELSLKRAGEAAAVTEERVRVLMHDDRPRGPYEVGEDLLADLPEPEGIGDLAALNQEAWAQRPELVALAENEAAFRDLAKLQGLAKYPRLDLVGNGIYANPNQRIFPPRQTWDATWDASVVLTWTPSDIIGASANQREQLARASQLAAQRQALVDGLQLEIRQAVSAVDESRVALETSRAGLTAAEAGYRVRRDLYHAGKATLVEVMDAEAELTRARLAVLDAHVEARIARVRLSFAVGR
jgi:outer membrane protein TolC